MSTEPRFYDLRITAEDNSDVIAAAQGALTQIIVSIANNVLGTQPVGTIQTAAEIVLTAQIASSTQVATDALNINVVKLTDDTTQIQIGDGFTYTLDVITDTAVGLALAAYFSASALPLVYAVGFAGLSAAFYSNFIDPITEDVLFTLAGGDEIKLIDASGEHIMGALYPDGFPQGSQADAVYSFITHPYITNLDVSGMRIDLDTSLLPSQSYRIYDASFLADLALHSDATSVNDLLARGNGTLFNDDGSVSNAVGDYLFFEEGTETLFVPVTINGTSQLMTINNVISGAGSLLFGTGLGLDIFQGDFTNLFMADSNGIIGSSGGTDLILGSSLGNTLNGGDGVDTLLGNGGNDTLIASEGEGEILDGGAGIDTADFSSIDTTFDYDVAIDLSNNTAFLDFTGLDNDTQSLFNIEHIITGAGDDTLHGDSGSNNLIGNAGYDIYEFGLSGSGYDTIIDDDGEIRLGGIVLSGEAEGGIFSASQDAGLWKMDVSFGEVTLLIQEDDLLIDWDGNAASDFITVKDFQSGDLGITLGNIAPNLQADNAETDINSSVVIDVLANDNDMDGILIASTVDVVTGFDASNGTTSVNTATGAVTYTPNADFSGEDSFIYTVEDNEGAMGLQVANITVSDDSDDEEEEETEDEEGTENNDTDSGTDANGDGIVDEYDRFVGRNLPQNVKFEKVSDSENFSVSNIGNHGEFTADYIEGPIALRHFNDEGEVEVNQFDEQGGTRELVDIHVHYEGEYEILGYFRDHISEYSEAYEIDGTKYIKVIYNTSTGYFGSSLLGVNNGALVADFGPGHTNRTVDGSEYRGQNLVDFSGDGDNETYLAVNDDMTFDSADGSSGTPKISFTTQSASHITGSHFYEGIAIYPDNLGYTESAGGFGSGPDMAYDAATNSMVSLDPIMARFNITSNWTNSLTLTYAYLEHSAPDTVSDSGTTYTETEMIIDVLSNDSDVDESSPIDTSTLAISTQAAHGTASVITDESGNKVIRYISEAGFSGEDEFYYTVGDIRGLTAAPQKVTVTVEASNAGTEEDDVLNGSVGVDLLQGYGGDDQLNGFDHDDSLDGGSGNNTLNGGHGNDSYFTNSTGNVYHHTIIYQKGDGNDIVHGAEGGFSTVSFGDEVSRYDVSLHVTGNELDINLNDGGNIRVMNQFGASGHVVDKLTFTDGSSIDVSSVATLPVAGDMIQGSANSESLYGTGNSDTMIGGAGNDYLHGSIGNDVYRYSLGDGSDFIYDYAGENNAIQFGAGVTYDELTFNKSGARDLRIDLTDGNFLIISEQLSSSGTRIADLVFDDGSVVSIADKGLVFEGTSGVDYIDATDAADTLIGYGGNDHLYGNQGDDVFVGGLGSDVMWGYGGDDRFVFESLADSTTSEMDSVFYMNPGTGGIDLSAIASITSMADLTLTPNAYWGYTLIEDADTSSNFAIKVYNTHSFTEADFVF